MNLPSVNSGQQGNMKARVGFMLRQIQAPDGSWLLAIFVDGQKVSHEGGEIKAEAEIVSVMLPLHGKHLQAFVDHIRERAAAYGVTIV